jgi:hypothetical protein
MRLQPPIGSWRNLLAIWHVALVIPFWIAALAGEVIIREGNTREAAVIMVTTAIFVIGHWIALSFVTRQVEPPST